MELLILLAGKLAHFPMPLYPVNVFSRVNGAGVDLVKRAIAKNRMRIFA